MDRSLGIARWVVPVLLGLVLFFPLSCVTGAGLCDVEAVNCDPGSVTQCYSVVGVPTTVATAVIAIPVLLLVTAAALRVRSRRAEPTADASAET